MHGQNHIKFKHFSSLIPYLVWLECSSSHESCVCLNVRCKMSSRFLQGSDILWRFIGHSTHKEGTATLSRILGTSHSVTQQSIPEELVITLPYVLPSRLELTVVYLQYLRDILVNTVPCHYRMPPSRVAKGGDDLQTQKVTANTLKKPAVANSRQELVL